MSSGVAQPSASKRLSSQPPLSHLITNSIGMKLVLIPAGEFQRGSPDSDSQAKANEKPQHQVRITRPFYLGTTEVTEEQWTKVMGTKPWKGLKDIRKGKYVRKGAEYPVTYVTWEETQEFCRKLSAREGVTYRLPTEAEWEYACRAGAGTKYSFGDDASALGEYGWYQQNATKVGEKYAHPVGLKRPNQFGLYDMHGNVWEWCADWYNVLYYRDSPVNDPGGGRQDRFRVIRGGCWFVKGENCRSANRSANTPGERYDYVGFRVARGSSEN